MIKSIRKCCNHDQLKIAIERISNFKLISSPGIFLGGIHTDGRQTHLLNKPGFDKTLMVMMKNRKYSEMTTEQLKTLRNRILFNLENEVNHHITQWQIRIDQILLVAKMRNLNLN